MKQFEEGDSTLVLRSFRDLDGCSESVNARRIQQMVVVVLERECGEMWDAGVIWRCAYSLDDSEDRVEDVEASGPMRIKWLLAWWADEQSNLEGLG
jgi:hypothetical protein